jgi:hypothetical protein
MNFLIFHLKFILFFGCAITLPLIYIGICNVFKLKLNNFVHLATWVIGIGFALFVFQINANDIKKFFDPPTPCDTDPDSVACMEYMNQDPYEDAQPGAYGPE